MYIYFKNNQPFALFKSFTLFKLSYKERFQSLELILYESVKSQFFVFLSNVQAKTCFWKIVL